MATSSYKTKLPLTTWFRIFGMHPLHAEQVRLATNTDPHCDQIMFQHAWQTSAYVGREEIAQAIAEAEQKIEQALGYRLCPTWEVDEWQETIRPYRHELININGADVRGYMQTVQANWGYMVSGGREAKDLISAGVSISYTDVDGDTYKEHAVVSVSTLAQDINEICIFYPGKDGEDVWEIRPIEVVIFGGTATISFRREQAVSPALLDVFDTEDAEAIGTEDSDFLTTVDVYRRYNDPQTQVSFLWEPVVDGMCNTCGGSGCSNCSYTTQTGCLIIRGDPRQSILGYHPADWNVTNKAFDNASWDVGRNPDITRLYYYAGFRDKSQKYTSRLSRDWEYTIAVMAAALLEKPPCDCVKGNWTKWREDMSLQSGDPDGFAYYRELGGLFGKSILDNPFGARRGEIYAWKKCQTLMIGTALVL